MKSLDITLLEKKAKEEKKSISCLLMSMLFFPPVGLGLYYWFVNDIIFNYDVVSPFSGFFIFFIIGLALTILTSFLYSQHWKSYNLEIDKANEYIVTLLQSGVLSNDDFFRLKKDYIERKIKKDELTAEEFEWHTNHICWCCGEVYKDKKINYTYVKSRTVRWKEGALKKSRTYKKSAVIPICLECYNKLAAENRQNVRNGDLLLKVDIIISAIITIGLGSYYIYTDVLYSYDSVLSGIGMSLFYLLAIGGVCASLGQILIYPIVALVAYPFLEKDAEAINPKWNFDNIPEIRKFLEMDLPLE